MNQDFFELLLENLEESPYPATINWNLKELYIKGLQTALIQTLAEADLIIVKV